MLLQNSRTRISQLMNTSGFHQNVGEGNKSFNAMSPDPLMSEALGKGSRKYIERVWLANQAGSLGPTTWAWWPRPYNHCYQSNIPTVDPEHSGK